MACEIVTVFFIESTIPSNLMRFTPELANGLIAEQLVTKRCLRLVCEYFSLSVSKLCFRFQCLKYDLIIIAAVIMMVEFGLIACVLSFPVK